MTATEVLRRLLDERGVEYEDRDMFGKHVFHWGVPLQGAMFTDAGEWTELVVENASPAQAIAATLGAGACRDVGDPSDFCCSECGTRMLTETDITYTMIDSLGNIIEQPNYCPNCGAKVVDE